MSKWQAEAYAFLDESAHSLYHNTRGSTVIARSVLVQDHADHGARVLDVESFTRALLSRHVRYLVTPPLASYKYYVQQYVDAAYGHLRQGPRLFLSTCDFLQLDTSLPFWRNALVSAGTLECIPNPDPDAETSSNTLTADDLTRATTSAPTRTAPVRTDWTLLEVLAEPLFYNNNFQGLTGSRIRDPPDWLRKKRPATMSKCRLVRISPSRRIECDKYYAFTKQMAAAGLTHVLHITAGWGAGETPHLLTHSELQNQCRRLKVRCPCDANTLARIQNDMPLQWKQVLDHATNSKLPNQTLADILRAAPLTLGAWYRVANRAGVATNDRVNLRLPYRINPLGIMTVDSDNLTVDSRRVSITQIHVWTHKRLAHNQAQREARERALARGEPDPFPPTLLTSGAVAGPIPGLPPPTYAPGANLSHFSLTYIPTDSLKQPTPMHRADVNHLYLSQLRTFYSPVRTLDPGHVATTTTSTTWTSLLQHPQASVQEIRSALVQAPMRADLPPALQETQLLVRTDALHVGARCVKKGCTKGICDLCYILLGTRTPETTRHIVLECPFTQPVLTTVWGAAHMAHVNPQAYAHARTLSADAFCSALERRIVFGVPK